MSVVGADRAPSALDQTLMQSAQKLILAAPEMTGKPGATLSRAELNAGLAQTTQGYLYLRYDVPGTVPQEFWAHWGHADKVSWKSGQVSVKQL